jgi:poly(hydroxyalkanoate) depolymerase family esterase
LQERLPPLSHRAESGMPNETARRYFVKRINKTIAAVEQAVRTTHVRQNPASIRDMLAALGSTSEYRNMASNASMMAEENFLDGSFANHAGTRRYKLYVPRAYHGQSLPLVVMLHGCSQDPDDFATGTRMNMIAEEQNCFVLYPAQSESANGSRCWNWYDALNQRRNLGEPSIIAGMTRDIMQAFSIDPEKVFIAGLSSGGAMAAILGATYPDLYRAVGIHSGLPYASARNLTSALAAMKEGSRSTRSGRLTSLMFLPMRKAMPTIVFHGDRDRTVHPRNGEQIIEQSISNAAHGVAGAGSKDLPEITIGQGKAENGRSYTHSVHRDRHGQVIAEHWVVHGTGHAWSGGSSSGSFTDSKGPDAAREMLRFFLSRV